jgi:hypothetical protein
MIDAYRSQGIFAHEDPVRAVADRVERLAPTTPRFASRNSPTVACCSVVA